jgi:DUF438 domain-containing protein
MSENLNNTSARKEELKTIIKTLNAADDHGQAKREMKKRFSAVLKTLSPEEIAEAEQALIAEGMPVAEVQKLCEIHVDAFEETLNRNAGRDRKGSKAARMPGHPVATYRAENAALKKELRRFALALRKSGTAAGRAELTSAFASLSLVETHYARKENQLFPFLEKAGFTGPSKVMWGKHDEIRSLIRDFRTALLNRETAACRTTGAELIRGLKRMIFMEEKILFPTALRKLSEPAWIAIRRGERAIGYAWIKPGNLWDPNVVSAGNPAADAPSADKGSEGIIPLSTGALSLEQINLMLTTLPLDISYVDEKDIVRYYSDTPERLFPRSPGIIGRAVQNCHPPASVHVVQKIIDDFKARKRTEAEFWITLKGKFIHIRYFPMFMGETFRGILEVSQDVTAIRALQGEKRLLDGE